MKDVNGKDRPCVACRWFVWKYGRCSLLAQNRQPYDTCSMWARKKEESDD